MIDYLCLTSTAMLVALLLDRLLGEPRRFHPLVGFGAWAKFLENRLYPSGQRPLRLWSAGLMAWLLAVMPLFILAAVFSQWLASSFGLLAYWLVSVVIIYWAIGARSLEEHAEAIAQPLLQADLIAARQALSMLVSRDTENLTEQEIATATIESVVENSHDSVIGVFFLVSSFWCAGSGVV